jgi:hypothetical protein
MAPKLIALVVVAAFTAQAASAQPGEHRGAACVARTAEETDAAWDGRTREYCEIRWSDLVAHGATRRWTQPDWIGHCVRRCKVGDVQADESPHGAPIPLAPLLAAGAGVGLAITAATLMSGHQSEQPASP